MEKFYVVPFTHEKYREFGKREFALGADRAPLESMLRLRNQQPQRDRGVLSLKAYFYQNPPAQGSVLEEYKQYAIVFFFNEACMRLYEDIGLELDVLKVITEEELPLNLEKAISGPYLPKY